MKQNLMFLTLVGGSLTILCFFMPWLKLELDPISYTFSGFSLAMRGLLGTIALIAASAIIGISIYMLKQQTPWKSRIPMLLSSGIGFLCVLGVLRLASHPALLYVPEDIRSFIVVTFGTRLARVDGTTIAEMNTQLTELISLQFGGFGASIGFILALIGAWSLPKSDPSMENSE